MSWPILWPRTVKIEEFEPDVVEYAETLARRALHVLTAGRLGGETITVVPNRDCTWRLGYLWNGRWFWGHPAAYHLKHGGVHQHNAIRLDMPVGTVFEVTHGAEVVHPSKYRIEGGEYLVRTDGEHWPTWEHDEFTVTYFHGFEVDITGQVVTGILAEEFLKSVTGARKCRLPNNLTTVTRAGMSFTMSTELFPNNATGITEVDTYVYSINPNMLTVEPQVYSPDIKKNRRIR